MAEEQIVTRIVATSDFSNLITDLNKVSSALTALQGKLNATNKNLAAQVAVMNRSFAETLRSTGQFSTHFVNLTSDVDKFGTQLDKGQIKLKQFFQIYQSHLKTNGGLVRQLAQQQVQLQNAILQPLGKNAEGLMQYNVHIPTGLDKVKSKTALAKQELQIMNRVIQEGANSLINWGKNTQWAGRQLTVGLTLPLAAFGKASADAFRQADQELTRLTKVYGGIAATSAQELGKIREDVTKTAAELSKSYGSSFKDTLALAADIAATGKQGNELLGSIKETTRLSVLGEVDRQDAMKATLAIQTAFKQNTEQLSESINFLNAVENQTSTTLNDLVEAIPKAGPIIQGLGGDVKDLALYLTAMREGGISASEGANALKSGLASLINPTKVATNMFAGFGIDLKGIVQKNAGDTTQTILALQAALETLNPLQKQQALEQLFGKFQFARMNALFENLGKQGSQTLQVMDLMKASSQDLANIAGRELSMVTESASGKYRRALEGLKADLAGVGEQFLNINTHLINLVDGILKFVNKLPGPIKTILSLFGGLTAVAGPLIMLTGVLGNFFGYIIKGASHFRSLFKGGEGWKLLTPEILAANKAGSIAETTFYSDAKAADILNQAITRLSASYTKLAADASNAIIATNPGVSTAAGTPLILSKPERVANPAHPKIGAIDTRAAAHGRPVGLMTSAEKSAQTIHSVTPNPILVNQAIGRNPQIFTYEDMPKIPGLTTQGGVSTGIVAGEAAKWHTLMATLSMQTKQETALLNKEIQRTGLVSQEFLTTYSTILPQITQVIDNAVLESQAIVRQTLNGKLRVDQAQAEIIRINAQLETALAQTTMQAAEQMGRTANITQVPLTGQPIVDPRGKSNLREMFRGNRRAKKMLDAIARATGVKTWGGGYSIETTMPKKFSAGGSVIGGPRSDTTDTQFAYLNEGDFVLNRKASDHILGFANGGQVPAMVTPGELVIHNPTPEELGMLEAYNNKFAVGGRVIDTKSNYGIPSLISRYAAVSKMFSGFRSPGTPYYRASRNIWDRTGSTTQSFAESNLAINFNKYRTTSSSVYRDPENIKYGITPVGQNKVLAHAFIPAYVRRLKSLGYGPNDQIPVSVLSQLGIPVPPGVKYTTLKALSSTWVKTSKRFNEAISESLPETNKNGTGWRDNWQNLNVTDMQSLLIKLKNMEVPVAVAFQIASRSASRLNSFIQNHKGPLNEFTWGKYVNAAEIGGMNDVLRSQRNKNISGRVQGLNRGGVVGGKVRVGKHNYGIMSGIGQNIGYMGSMMGGGALGGKLGGNMGALAGSILAPALLQSVLTKITAVNKAGMSSAGIFTRLGPLLANPYVAAGAAAVGLIAVLVKIKSHFDEVHRINRLAWSGGVKPLKDFDSELKQVRKTIENTKETAALLHAQMNSAGLTGLTLTIKQFADLKEKVKSTYPELIKLFKQTPDDKLSKVAEGLKAQFVAAGESAAEANAKIAALLSLSDKGGFIQSVLGSQGVSGIKDATTALSAMLKAMDGFTDDKDRAAGLLQIFTTMSGALEKAKDKGAALKEQFDLIAKSNQANVKLTEGQIVEISKLDPLLAGILNTDDDIGTALAKWRINVAGFAKDLGGLSKGALQEFAAGVEAINAYYIKILDTSSKEAQSNKLTGQMAKDIEAFNKKQSVASKAAIDNIQKQIDLKNKQIDQIKKEGEARKKALRDQQQVEDVKLQIQQEQLNYQMALAAGDMSSAAQAQINIQRLVGAQQLKTAEDAIDESVQAKIDALQAQIDALNTKSSTISSSSATAKPKESPLTGIYQGINTTYKDLAIGNIDEKQALTQFNDLIKKLEMTSGGKKYLKDLGVTGSVNNLVREDRGTTVANIDPNSAGGAALLKALQKGSDNIVSQQLVITNKRLQEILDAIKNSGINVSKPLSAADALSTVAAGGTYSAGKTKTNFDYKTKDLAGTAQAAFNDRESAHASIRNATYRLFGFNGMTYAVNTTTGDIYDYDTTKNTVGKKPISSLANTKNRANGGIVNKYASAGFVVGPGTGTSDSIPAMLSNGEYVIRAASVQAVGTSFLDGINKMSAGGIATKYSVPRMNLGGRVNMGNAGYASTSNALYNINVTLNGTDLSADDVARAIESRMKMAQIKQGRDRIIA